jgi:hypothetical protein
MYFSKVIFMKLPVIPSGSDDRGPCRLHEINLGLQYVLRPRSLLELGRVQS